MAHGVPELGVAAYLQRYCAKNDTIGYFGPVGWGRWSDQGPALVATPGAGLLAERAVHFEHWAIDALAQRLSQDAEVRSWLEPWLAPHLRVEGRTLSLPRRRVTLSKQVAQVVAACTVVGAAAALRARR